jgi:hypothetical protein
MVQGILKHNAKANDSFWACPSPQSSPHKRGEAEIAATFRVITRLGTDHTRASESPFPLPKGED